MVVLNRIIEFNSFGAHLNTGSDLFHWVDDKKILYGENDGITVRFTEREMQFTPDTSQGKCDSFSVLPTPTSSKADVETSSLAPAENPGEDAKPDWLALEEKLRAKFRSVNINDGDPKASSNKRTKLPLGGRWSSAY
ncbi:hypothetical protein AJ79_07806 [Helicocarpus griseus UAMH5409]|uniref:Uncharacterized protein n=1 Tax=Helicocarpus griseus UAMH5409 TaxID=1447875 RepID=A0A2B7WZ32_9EURO|nr:hypothetical protein AJ79_07806 [Helicocarpus griseus UAMH5409]